MPHRVATFFRSSTSTLENSVTNLKKAAIRRTTSPNRPAARHSRSSERVFSYASSIDEDPEEVTSPNASMPSMPGSPHVRPAAAASHNATPTSEHHHRLSFPGLHIGRSSKEAHSNPHVDLSWKIESPPIVLHGDAENSSGALVSGQLFLDIKEDAYEVDSFKAVLNIHVTQKRPFTVHCQECAHQHTEIATWDFLQQPLALKKGRHPFPFSVLLGGHLPATLDGPLESIAYEFKAEATPRIGTSVKLEKILDVKRSLPASELPHHSVRVFPPTNIKASVHYPQVIHPIGTNTLTLKLDGIAKTNEKANTVEYWKLKKLTWRLEETAKTIAPACEKHSPKEPKDQDPEQAAKKGVQRTETRIIGEKTLFGGWKSCYAGPTDSCVDIELEYALGKHSKYSCDLKARDGSEVSHQLMIEMVVSQEWAPVGKPALVTQTGVGRILRMHFGTVLTERGGIGISWDNEAPPIYQDVPPSPPAYVEDMALGAADSISEHLEPLDHPSSRSSVEGHNSI